jgi:hypothetical protein
MGWSFRYNQTKESLIKELTENQTGSYPENKMMSWICLDYSIKGNCLWSVWERINSDTNKSNKYIRLDLLRYSKEDGGYGYKDMCESMGPFYYSCPLKFFSMAPVANQEWRNEVMKKHAETKAKKSCALKVNIGDIVELVPECKVKALKIERKVKSSFVGYDRLGKTWKVTHRYLTGKLLESL